MKHLDLTDDERKAARKKYDESENLRKEFSSFEIFESYVLAEKNGCTKVDFGRPLYAKLI